MRYILLLFVVMPILEMWLLISVGSQIGAPLTIFLVLLTALLGVGLLREQGFATFWRARQKLYVGELPATEIAEGLILAVSGALLLTPGFVTDIIGFTGLVQPIRVIIATMIIKNMMVVAAKRADFNSKSEESNNRGTESKVDNIIDGESWECKDLE